MSHTNITKNDVKIVATSKDLSNFWRSLNMSLINCEVPVVTLSKENDRKLLEQLK